MDTAGNASPLGAELEASTLPRPNAPTSFGAIAVGAGSATFNWTAPAGSVDFYRIFYSVTSGGPYTLAEDNIVGTGASVTLPPGTLYCVCRAVLDGIESADSNEDQVEVL